MLPGSGQGTDALLEVLGVLPPRCLPRRDLAEGRLGELVLDGQFQDVPQGFAREPGPGDLSLPVHEDRGGEPAPGRLQPGPHHRARVIVHGHREIHPLASRRIHEAPHLREMAGIGLPFMPLLRNVHAEDRDLPPEVPGDLGQMGNHHLAGRAPGRPELHKVQLPLFEMVDGLALEEYGKAEGGRGIPHLHRRDGGRRSLGGSRGQPGRQEGMARP